ncbi:MAG: LacI family DNA-binding transcriptional regulator [Pseudomonadota bacterium]
MNFTEKGRLKGRSRNRVTLADVAREAGVATMTASRSISQPELVSSELRFRVEQAVKKLGYLPNRAARALASGQSRVIAVLIPSLSNAVFTEVLAGVQDALATDGYQILIGNTRYSDQEEEKLLNIHLQSNPDGILLTGMSQSESVRKILESSQVPTVSMMDLSDDPQRLSVGFSQHEAGYTMTRHLLNKGYAKIGFIGAQLDERAMKRAEGYRQALRDAGLYDIQRELLVPEPSDIALGVELVGRLLAMSPDCDAIFCCNDDLAYGAIYQCQRRQIRVPEQLAVCGFNDLAGSAWMNPSVTTIKTPRYRIGYEAAVLLRSVILGETPATHRVDLGFTLMAREST